MRQMVNDVSAPYGVSSNDLMVILNSVILFWITLY